MTRSQCVEAKALMLIQEEWDSLGERKYYITSDGKVFDDLNFPSALQHECWWLTERNDDNI